MTVRLLRDARYPPFCIVIGFATFFCLSTQTWMICVHTEHSWRVPEVGVLDDFRS